MGKQTNSELAQVFTCPCSKRNYNSLKSLKSHQKTKMHKAWEETRELRSLKKDLTIRDNKIMKLEHRIDTLMDLNNVLLERIKSTSRMAPSP